jgi:hypothetical protein
MYTCSDMPAQFPRKKKKFEGLGGLAAAINRKYIRDVSVLSLFWCIVWDNGPQKSPFQGVGQLKNNEPQNPVNE